MSVLRRDLGDHFINHGSEYFRGFGDAADIFQVPFHLVLLLFGAVNFCRRDFSIGLESPELRCLCQFGDEVVGPAQFVHPGPQPIELADGPVNAALVADIFNDFLKQGQCLVTDLGDLYRFVPPPSREFQAVADLIPMQPRMVIGRNRERSGAKLLNCIG